MMGEDWFEVFRTGRHTDSTGQTREWTDADLETIARQYKPEEHEAPIVLGHPAHDAPAYGWIEALKIEGGKLLAKPKQLAEEFVQWVRDGRYKKVSIALYPDLTLRHVGFLGAQPPAVKGLAPAAFGDAGRAWTYWEPYQEAGLRRLLRNLREWLIESAGAETADRVVPQWELDTLEPPQPSEVRAYRESEQKERAMEKKTFLEWLREGLRELGIVKDEPTAAGEKTFSEAEVQAREQAAATRAREEALRQAQAERRAAEAKARVLQFVEAGISQGAFLPAWRELGLPAVLEQALLTEQPLQFAEGKPAENAGEILFKFLESLPKLVTLTEVAKPAKGDQLAGDTVAAKLDALTRARMAEKKLAYGPAFLEVQREHAELAQQYAEECRMS